MIFNPASYLHNACHATLPPMLCQHSDVLLYLAPTVPMAIIIYQLSRRHPFFFLFLLTGTICHELAHLCVGFLTGARPADFSLIPRRKDTHWVLGSVSFSNLRWYNAAPTALAPFLILVVPFVVAAIRTSSGYQFTSVDLLILLAITPQFLSFWPSATDWKLALLSWPYLAGALIWWLMQRFWG